MRSDQSAPRRRLLAGLIALASALAIIGTGASPAGAEATGARKRNVLIIMVEWDAARGTPAAPRDSLTAADAEAQIGSIDNTWYQSASYSQFGGWNAQATGWYQIKTPPLDNGGCGLFFRTNVIAYASQAAANDGYRPSLYDAVMYYFSAFAPCPWSGDTNGTAVMINGSMDTLTTVHELGHVLGLGHGHALECTVGSGYLVALSSTCTTIDYGDVYNAMGADNAGTFSAIQMDDLGWLDSREQWISPFGGTYVVHALETTPVLTKTLRVDDAGVKLWLEYRRPFGNDSFLPPSSINGVLFHQELTDPTGNPLGSYLLDMTPGSAGGTGDAPLPAGASWTNPLGHLTFRVDWIGQTAAQVTVLSPYKPAPDVVGQPYAGAISTIKTAGFVVSQTSVIDRTCNSIGLVTAQSPLAGTPLLPGATVHITVAVKPPTPCP